MTEYPLDLIRSRGQLDAAKPRRLLTELDSDRYSKHLVVFRPDEKAVDDLVQKASKAIPGLTDSSVVHRVLRHNPDCVIAIARKRKFNPAVAVGDGFFAFLPLNKAGLYQLAAGALDTQNPDLSLISRPDETPAGIYVWATFAPGPIAAGVALAMEKMDVPPYAGVTLYSRPNTPEGFRFNENLGWKRGAKIGPIYAPHLYTYLRNPVAPPLYDSYRRDGSEAGVSVTVARTFEDLMRVSSLRSAVYIGEQECPYEEEFDGNDLSATHLIGYVGNEPAGCLRIRFFADFAKLERLAVRKEFRSTRLSFQIVRAAIRLCQMKGYKRLYGHSQKRLMNFWGRFGFRPLEGAKEFVFSDFDYVELVADVEKDPNSIGIGADPYVLIRPEGRWHVPGILERSAARKATRPSVQAKVQATLQEHHS